MAVALGPILGGWLLVHFWWGSVFLINLPVVALALVAGRFLVPTSRDPGRTPLDPIGSLLSIAGLVLILYGLIEAPIRGWGDALILGAFGLGLAVFVVFALWELRVEHPMLDLRAFRRPALTGGSLAISFVFFAMFGTFFMLTQYFQIVHGYSPLGAGVRLLPMAIAMLVVSPSSARLAERLGTKAVVTTGLLIVAIGLSTFSRVQADTSYVEIGLILGFLAVGMGMTMPPSTSAIMSSLPMAKAGVGSAINDTTRELGGALGVAVLGSVLTSRYTAHLGPVVRQLPTGARHAALASVGGAVRVSQQIGGRAGTTFANAARHAFTDAMGTALIVAATVALAAAGLIAWLMPRDVVYEEETAAAGEAQATEPVFAD
jgi:EmrB/QacA subfamily drug resistance transporter